MMESPQVVESFWSQLEQSGLLTPPQMAAVGRELVASGKTTDEDMARLLVQRNLLTQFQADRLLEGRARGFFFDKYKIIDVLGIGGMGWVYEAEDTATGEIVALKVLLDILKHDRGLLARFQQEARVGLRLRHPNIVRTHLLGSAGGQPYMTMEFVHGPSLLELILRHKRLPWAQACEFARQAALGLHHAHEHGIVHRDVKPQNLLIDETGRVRLLDFGLSMIREGESGDEFSMAMIFGHECVGTAEFMAPEQADDSLSVDGRSDVYSLGGTLFAALIGDTPFRGKTAADMLKAHHHEQPRSVRDIVPSIPSGVADIVARMLEKDPERRFASAAEAAAALAEWAKPGPVEFDFAALLAERKKQAQQRLAQLPKSRPAASGLASSTARPATISSVAKAPSGARAAHGAGGSLGSSRSSTWRRDPAGSPLGPDARLQQMCDSAARGNGEGARAIESNAVLLSPGSGRDMPLLQDHIVIGRREDCDLQLQDTAVSGRHCELHFDGSRWWITDLGSRNGTRVNGTAVKHQSLRSGDEILIGNQLRFRLNYSLPGSEVQSASQKHRSRRSLFIWITVVFAAALSAFIVWWATTT